MGCCRTQGAEACGAALMVVAGLMLTSRATMAVWMQREQWPFYRILVVSTAAVAPLVVLQLAVAVLSGQVALPRWRAGVWVAGRAVCSVVSSLLSLVAVRLGTPVGDVAALASVNTVAAALLGRLFLGEALQRAHAAGLLCSLAGALLIGLSGADAAHTRAFLGYPLAVLSGLAQAFQFVFARKSQGVPWQLLSIAGTVALVALISVAVATGLVEDYSLEPVQQDPWQAVLWVAALGAVLYVSTSATAVAAQLCPAAVSATLNTGVSMVSGYVVQALVFDAGVKWLSLLGAALMLTSMLLMAMNKVSPAASAGTSTEQADSAGGAEASIDDGAEGLRSFASFASFASAEFAAASPAAASPAAATAVQRRAARLPPAAPAANALGAAVVGVACCRA